MDDDFLEYVPIAAVQSPCIGICKVDSVSRTCKGCDRTLAEIAEWPDATDARRQAILDRIATKEA
ncbi:DUF1289 domain-containing protein [Sphingomonas sp. AX6]|uniref:DUF1289 domain-containing protein n=1 Tax=Sphingomonas sp. AX6 TaxID=2653171 RepID=UPI0012F324B2|nr:DUF1289 domain-containing protein [Sphingomonas sp. AX6]VXD00240.1 conserved hypothetical protein [Sphingomonas sp. AX6]